MTSPKIILAPGVSVADLIRALMASGLAVSNTREVGAFVINRCSVKPLLRECDPSGGRDFLRSMATSQETL